MESRLDRKSFIGASLGTLIEYYDYTALMIFLPIIAPLFFPAASTYESLVKGFYTLLIALLARPLGALFFGHIGDIYGRRKALLGSVYGIAIATILLGLTPSYEYIGSWSIVMLTLTKAVQAFCFGGEYNGAGIYVVEHAQEKHEGLIGSILTATMSVGVLIATLVGYVITWNGMPSWSWRVAIILGGILGIIAASSRKNLAESPHFQKADPQTHGIKVLIKEYPYELLAGIFLGGFATVPFGTIITFINPVLMTKNIISPQTLMLLQSLIIVISIVSVIIAGRAADIISPYEMVNLSALMLTFFSFPLLWIIALPQLPFVILGQAFFCIMTNISIGPSNAYLKNLFPMQFRYRGASLSFTIGLSLFGGLTPIVENYLYAKTGSMSSISVWLVLVAFGTYVFVNMAQQRRMKCIENPLYTQTTSKFGNLTRRRPEFKPGESDVEAAQQELR